MGPTNALNDVQLQKFQDEMFRTAKEKLEKDGRVMPMTFILTRKMHIDKWLRESILDVETWEQPSDDGSTPMDYIFLMVPCLYDDAKTLVHMLKYLSKDPEATSRMFEMLVAVAPAFNQEDPYEKILKVFKSINKTSDGGEIHNKDIIASFIKTVCRRTEAIAYVKVDEAWQATGKIPKGEKVETLEEARKYVPSGSLEDDPDSKEMLMCYLETKTIKKHISELFMREVRGTGKILGWGKRDVLFDDGKGDQIVDGRFSFLLQKRQPDSELQEDDG